MPSSAERAAGADPGWTLLAALLAGLALIGWWLPPAALDWQPARAATEPWRAFSAVAVHYSGLHLGANLAGAVLVGAVGWAAGVPRRCSLAWLCAWPLTQVGLLSEPALLHYGGLSGVLHAGVAVAALHLLWRAVGRRRLIGLAVLLVLVLKVLLEAPWGPPLRYPAGWDIAVVPLAHACGLLAGIVCGALAEAAGPRRQRGPAADPAPPSPPTPMSRP